MDKINEIRQLIGQAKLGRAIGKLLDMQTEFQDVVIGLQTRLKTLERKEMMGIIDSRDAGLEQRTITASLLDILTQMESKSRPEEKKSPIAVTDESHFEKVIGRNGLQRIDWLSKGLEKAKSVCKIRTANGEVGTGFLVEGGYIFTNNHVLPSPSVAQYSRAEFGYDNPDTPSIFYDLDHVDFVTSANLDYTRVKVKDNNSSKPLGDWGFLSLSNRIPGKDDALVIIQHPQGRTKEIAFSEMTNGVWEHRLHYTVSTEPGSSGSPVFDVGWEVIALHHAGGMMPVNAKGDRAEVNEGIIFDFILKDLAKRESNAKNDHVESASGEMKRSLSGPVKTMLVYNPADERYAEGARQHLFTLERNGKMDIFDMNTDIEADAGRNEALKHELENADLVLIFISSNLYKRDTKGIALEVERYIGKKRVVPIRVSPFNLTGTPFGNLQGLPANGKSIDDYGNKDQALYEISSAISRLIENMGA